jgi:hypothetical protein
MSLSVEDIQTTRELFQLNNKARVLERACIVAKKGAKGPIFEGNMLPQKMHSFFVRR